jgi:protein-tyrosine phosphatase
MEEVQGSSTDHLLPQHDDKGSMMVSSSPPPPPPWAWIKSVRDLTDPVQYPAPQGDSLELPVEILPYLLLSDRKSAMNMTQLKQWQVTHILSVHAFSGAEKLYYQERLKGTGIIHKRVSCHDTEGYDMIGKHWKECHDFIKTVKEQPKGVVVVHCMAGINRSGLIVCAAHMVLERQPVLAVVQHCMERRGMVLWNRSFQQQLVELAQQEGLLGPHPDFYDDTPLVDIGPPPLPAHEVLGVPEIKFRLYTHLSSLKQLHQSRDNNPTTDND